MKECIAGYIVEADNGSERYFFWPDEINKALNMLFELQENGWPDAKKTYVYRAVQ